MTIVPGDNFRDIKIAVFWKDRQAILVTDLVTRW